MTAQAISAERLRNRKRRLIKANGHEPHLVLEFDIPTGLFTITLTGVSQDTRAAMSLDTILSDPGGKATRFITAV